MKAAANGLVDRAGVGGREHDAGYDAAQALVGCHCGNRRGFSFDK